MLFRLAACAALSIFTAAGAAQGEPCVSNPSALGTSRIIKLNPAEHRKLGMFHRGEALPLEDGEVVLTFDDGPLPPKTNKVLDALAAECVKAHFFVVGQMARAYPGALRRVYAEGHTIGTHTEHHRQMTRLTDEEAEKEISSGIASVNEALGGARAAPFFRFPYLAESAGKDDVAVKLGLTIWSIDFHAGDWSRTGPQRIAAVALERLERYKRGILMLHDIHERTALALPILFAEFKKRGYRVVQVVPGAPDSPAAASQPNWPVEGAPGG